MGKGSVYLMGLIGAFIIVIGSVALKTYAELVIEKELPAEEEDEFSLSVEDEETFDRLRHAAVRNSEFIKDCNAMGIDIDDIDSDYITSVSDTYINLTLVDGTCLSLGELNGQLIWRMWRENEDKREMET